MDADFIRGFVAACLIVPMLFALVWVIGQLIKLGLEDRRDKKIERWLKVIDEAAGKQNADLKRFIDEAMEKQLADLKGRLKSKKIVEVQDGQG